MERPLDTDGPPPVPPRSPLRETADLDISRIFQHPIHSDEEADVRLQRHYKALSKNIDSLIDRLRPGTSSTSLISTERTPKRRAEPYRHFSSGVASVSSVYSQDWDTFDLYTSSATTSSRPSYSSSRPISTASTNTIYSTISTSAPTKATIHRYQTPAPTTDSDPSIPTPHPTHLTGQQLFDMIDQLPPIIYRHGDDDDDADNGDDPLLFPPHPGVRPPSSSIISRRSLEAQPPPPPLPTAWLSVPKRAASLRFSLRKRRTV